MFLSYQKEFENGKANASLCHSMSVGLSAHLAFCLFFLLNRSECVPVRDSEIILMSVSLM